MDVEFSFKALPTRFCPLCNKVPSYSDRMREIVHNGRKFEAHERCAARAVLRQERQDEKRNRKHIKAARRARRWRRVFRFFANVGRWIDQH